MPCLVQFMLIKIVPLSYWGQFMLMNSIYTSWDYATIFNLSLKMCQIEFNSLLEIWHFATVLCNWFPVACDTCNWKFAQLRTTSCMKFVVASDSTYMTSIYGWVIRFHPPILYISSWKCDCVQTIGVAFTLHYMLIS